MSTIKTKILGAYITAILAAFVWGPLIALHGYRQWWLVMFYAAFRQRYHRRIIGTHGSMEV